MPVRKRVYQNFINIFTAPGLAFTSLRAKPLVLIPLLIFVAGIIGTNFLYASFVDQAFMMEEIIEGAGEDLTSEQQQAMRDYASSDNSGRMLLVTTASGAVFFVLLQLLHAAYFLVVALFSSAGHSYKHWLSFVCWTGMPRLLVYAATMVAVVLAPDGRIGLYEMNPLALTNLLSISLEDMRMQQVFANLDLTLIWTVGLMVFGFMQWTDRSLATAAAIVLAPYFLVFGTWIALIS